MNKTPVLPGYSVADLARRWKVGEDKIRLFIRRGDLLALNMATDLAGKAQWRVTEESVRAFESKRSSAPAPKRKRRRRTPVIDYYPNHDG